MPTFCHASGTAAFLALSRYPVTTCSVTQGAWGTPLCRGDMALRGRLSVSTVTTRELGSGTGKPPRIALIRVFCLSVYNNEKGRERAFLQSQYPFQYILLTVSNQFLRSVFFFPFSGAFMLLNLIRMCVCTPVEH